MGNTTAARTQKVKSEMQFENSAEDWAKASSPCIAFACIYPIALNAIKSFYVFGVTEVTPSLKL
ncbi:MAG: hypothetical protein OHK0037_05940 [Elainellaceae cyanobacterium]